MISVRRLMSVEEPFNESEIMRYEPAAGASVETESSPFGAPKYLAGRQLLEILCWFPQVEISVFEALIVDGFP